MALWSEVLGQALPGLAASDAPLLIVGESGIGRATLADRIHGASGRTGPRLTVFCSGTTAPVLAARYASAAGGTLCLRDLELLPAAAQGELTRLLAEPGPVRVIATATPEVRACAADGRLLPDLWRQMERFEVPPLRERMDEVPDLTAAMLAALTGGPPPLLSDEVKAALLSYRWPLNLRELRECLAHAVGNAGSGQPIGLEHLPPAVAMAYNEAAGPGIYERFRNAVERTLLEWTSEGIEKREQHAERLGLSRAGLYKQLKKHGMTKRKPKGRKRPRPE